MRVRVCANDRSNLEAIIFLTMMIRFAPSNIVRSNFPPHSSPPSTRETVGLITQKASGIRWLPGFNLLRDAVLIVVGCHNLSFISPIQKASHVLSLCRLHWPHCGFLMMSSYSFTRRQEHSLLLHWNNKNGNCSLGNHWSNSVRIPGKQRKKLSFHGLSNKSWVYVISEQKVQSSELYVQSSKNWVLLKLFVWSAEVKIHFFLTAMVVVWLVSFREHSSRQGRRGDVKAKAKALQVALGGQHSRQIRPIWLYASRSFVNRGALDSSLNIVEILASLRFPNFIPV